MTDRHELTWSHAVDMADYDTAAEVQTELLQDSATPESEVLAPRRSIHLKNLNPEEFDRMIARPLDS